MGGQCQEGSREVKPVVLTTMMAIKSLFKQADEEMSALLAIYDLYQIAKAEDPNYTGDCQGCFAGNRKKLLDLKLVDGGSTGPLRMHSSIRNVVVSALTLGADRLSVELNSPVAGAAGR